MASVEVTLDMGKKGLQTVTVKDGSVEELIKVVQAKFHVDPTRQSFKYEDPARKSEAKYEPVRFSAVHLKKKLSDLGVPPKAVLTFKKLGLQFSYRGVFFWEYFGPFAIMLLAYLRPAFLYGEAAAAAPFSRAAQFGAFAFMFHYFKREFETFFIHRFSRPTMPLTNLFKNCSYYWTFAALIAYPLCHPLYTAPTDAEFYIGLAMFVAGEFINFLVHLHLRNARPASDTAKRDVPEGWLFSLVSCPNYTAEVTAWVGFAVMVRVVSVYLFVAVGALQMTVWAFQKHKGYIRADPTYRKRGRRAIFPFIL